MHCNRIEQIQCSFEIFTENKYYIIDHVGTLLLAPGLALDMMLIWQSCPHFRFINKIAHCNCHISPCNARIYFLMSWQGDTSDTAIS